MSMADRTLDELFVQHRPKLVWTVYRIVRCSETAEDVVQETYLRVAAALRDHPVRMIRPFLYRTARNLAIDHVRGNRIRGRIVTPTGDERALDTVPSALPSPERQTLDRQRVGRLEAALGELSPRRREILSWPGFTAGPMRGSRPISGCPKALCKRMCGSRWRIASRGWGKMTDRRYKLRPLVRHRIARASPRGWKRDA